MAHYSKYLQEGAFRLISHDKREHTHLQKHIKKDKSYLNYNLCMRENERDYYKKRKEEALKTGSRFNKRSIAVLSCVITLPQDFPYKDDPEKVKEFFKECVSFLHKIHGSENCLSAWVHLDESNPHLHYKTMPLVKQKNKDGKDIIQFNAKKILNRSYLKSFHKNLQKHLEEKFGFKVSILNGATTRGNITVPQLREQEKELSVLLDTLENIRKEIATSKKELQENEKDLNDIIDEYNLYCDKIDLSCSYLNKLRKQVEEALKDRERLADEILGEPNDYELEL